MGPGCLSQVFETIYGSRQDHQMPDTPTQPAPDVGREDRPLTREEAIAELRALIEEGLASGIDDREDIESIKQEVRRRLAESRRA
jgi:hypothetical protein